MDQRRDHKVFIDSHILNKFQHEILSKENFFNVLCLYLYPGIYTDWWIKAKAENAEDIILRTVSIHNLINIHSIKYPQETADLVTFTEKNP